MYRNLLIVCLVLLGFLANAQEDTTTLNRIYEQELHKQRFTEEILTLDSVSRFQKFSLVVDSIKENGGLIYANSTKKSGKKRYVFNLKGAQYEVYKSLRDANRLLSLPILQANGLLTVEGQSPGEVDSFTPLYGSFHSYSDELLKKIEKTILSKNIVLDGRKWDMEIYQAWENSKLPKSDSEREAIRRTFLKFVKDKYGISE